MASPALDLTFLNELYEEIDRHPPAIEARKILTQHCYEAGWTDTARDTLRELRVFDPTALEEEPWTRTLLQPPEEKEAKKPAASSLLSPAVLEVQKLELVEGYRDLRSRAKKMLNESRLLGSLDSSPASTSNPELKARFEAHDSDLKPLVNGRVSSVLKSRQPGPARGIARQMEERPENAVDIANSDLEDVARWLRSHNSVSSAGDNDEIREALAKRTQALSAALPDTLKKHASTAMMHIEHEVIRRKYHSEETMYGDLVADIPRAHFLVTEDGYAWDMEELAQAIKSNGGIMRNPLNKLMFTADDVRSIVQHHLGRDLAALQVEQSRLFNGIRAKTIDELDRMAKVFHEDMSEDQLKSREILETFIAYVATLPDAEQEALDKLRVPAFDSHTGRPLPFGVWFHGCGTSLVHSISYDSSVLTFGEGMAFDTSVGEAVRDAQGNKVCLRQSPAVFLTANFIVKHHTNIIVAMLSQMCRPTDTGTLKHPFCP